MTFTGFLTYSFALFVAAAVPGPGVVALVARALGSGFRATVPAALGLVLGDLAYLTAAILGLAVIAKSFTLGFIAFRYAGAAYLGWLAYKFWTAGVGIEQIEAQREEGPFASFISGLIVTLGNPKVMVFYLAILPAIVDLSAVTFNNFIVLVLLTAAVLLLVLLPYIALAARTRTLLQTPKAMQRMSRVAAAFLGLAAIAIALRA